MKDKVKEAMENFRTTSLLGKNFDGEILTECKCKIGRRITNVDGKELEAYFIVSHGVITHQFDNYNQARCVVKDLFGVNLDKPNE